MDQPRNDAPLMNGLGAGLLADQTTVGELLHASKCRGRAPRGE